MALNVSATRSPAPGPAAAARRPRRRAAGRRRDAGFTLIEAVLATIIVGTGVLAIVAAQQAYAMKNGWAQRTNQGMLLANEIRELTLSLPLHDPFTGRSHYGPETGEGEVPIVKNGKTVGYRWTYDDLDDFAGKVGADGLGRGVTFIPPISALSETIPDMPGWSQHVTVGNVLPDFIDATKLLRLGSTNMMRVTVVVKHQGPHDAEPQTVNTLSWVVTE